MTQRTLVGLQIVLALVGLAASLIPSLPKTNAFWGCNRIWSSMSPTQIGIIYVASDSAAAAAGLRCGDQVVSIGGKAIHDATIWDEAIRRLRPGDEIAVKVKRFAEDDAELVLRGIEPQREAIVYYDWQLGFAAGCTLFAIAAFVTQSLRPRLAFWRPILLILAGLTVVAVLLFTPWHNPWNTVMFQRCWPLDNLHFPWVPFAVCLAVAIMEVGLGSWELRRTIQAWHSTSAGARVGVIDPDQAEESAR